MKGKSQTAKKKREEGRVIDDNALAFLPRDMKKGDGLPLKSLIALMHC